MTLATSKPIEHEDEMHTIDANGLKDLRCPTVLHDDIKHRDFKCDRFLGRADLATGSRLQIKCPKCKMMRMYEVI